jgi:hypothetical protein
MIDRNVDSITKFSNTIPLYLQGKSTQPSRATLPKSSKVINHILSPQHIPLIPRVDPDVFGTTRVRLPLA